MCETGSHSGRRIQRTREGRGRARQAVTVGDKNRNRSNSVCETGSHSGRYMKMTREGRGCVRQAVTVGDKNRGLRREECV